ncbi:WecB/TagA/CpsF family glycosyltransferase [Azospirillum sp.]|uniref:WecB/TagA/CpsF family glycosyltransferase n=1 Tax=Azospirillum sp. TaxID=34012 RepID=UPI003D71B656
MSNSIRILGQPIDNVSLDGALKRVEDCLAANRFAYGVTPNVDHIMKLRHDADFRAVYAGASLRVADGVPLVWASRCLGTPLRGRVNGTDLFERLSARAAARGWSIFLLGGAGDSAACAAATLTDRHPALRIAGVYAPAHGFEHDAKECWRIQAMVRRSGADILFVGVGAPKQERWIARHGAGCGVRFAIGIGVSFSFVAGSIPRAPRWMRVHGLEWLWRLSQEPRRLWRRYLIDDLPFLWLVALERLQGPQGQREEIHG